MSVLEKINRIHQVTKRKALKLKIERLVMQLSPEERRLLSESVSLKAKGKALTAEHQAVQEKVRKSGLQKAAEELGALMPVGERFKTFDQVRRLIS